MQIWFLDLRLKLSILLNLHFLILATFAAVAGVGTSEEAAAGRPTPGDLVGLANRAVQLVFVGLIARWSRDDVTSRVNVDIAVGFGTACVPADARRVEAVEVDEILVVFVSPFHADRNYCRFAGQNCGSGRRRR